MNADRERRDYLPIDERREQVLDAAIELVADQGAAALSLRSIATRMGVAHRVVHYAFGSKAALVTALLRRESRRTMALVWQEEFAAESFGRAVHRALRSYVADLRAREGIHRAVSELTAAALSSPALTGAVRAEADAYQEAIEDRIGRWAEASGARLSEPPHVVASAILAAADGIAQWWFTSADEQRIDVVVDILSSGFVGLELIAEGAEHARD